MHFTGSWTFMNDSALISEDGHCCHVTQTSGDQASYAFRGSSVQLAGLTNATSGNFNVTLSSEFDPSVIIQQQISGSSAFTTYTTLFYASGLDSDAAHMLTITNLENKTLAIDTMNVTVVSGGQRYVRFYYLADISSVSSCTFHFCSLLLGIFPDSWFTNDIFFLSFGGP
ncbi:hypothetical protein DFH11DRAFT_1502100 [Phellopilus nigrolimitatus]|nr:hypothetical protein DFH11DRAFT_1502100 [Phellopilus nigrolimitatus]